MDNVKERADNVLKRIDQRIDFVEYKLKNIKTDQELAFLIDMKNFLCKLRFAFIEEVVEEIPNTQE